MKIKIKVLEGLTVPAIIAKGDWIDLRAAKKTTLHKPKVNDGTVDFDTHVVPLGVCMKLPKGFEAVVNARSSSFKNFGFIVSNAQGIIDNTYCGDADEWRLPIIAYKDAVINIDDRICQFRIQLSQKATVLQKLRWLFSNKIEFEFVDSLDEVSRGGIGTTGINEIQA